MLEGDALAQRSLLERSKLRRELRRLDTVFFLLSAMVVVDTIGAVAVGGAEAFTWLLVLFATFFVPSALASAELGAALPEEGGCYVWVRTAFGRFAGALTSLLYWAGTPMWLGGSVTAVAIAVEERFFGDLGSVGSYVFGTASSAARRSAPSCRCGSASGCRRAGRSARSSCSPSSLCASCVYGVRHGVHGLAVDDLRRPRRVRRGRPVLIYSFVGIELPSTAAEEMVDPRRDIPAAIARAGVGQLVMYGVPVLAVLVVLPPTQVTSLHGLIDAMQHRVHRLRRIGRAGRDGDAHGAGGVSAAPGAALFIWVLLASGSAWIMGAGRAQAAACLDGGGPAALGRISERTGVPVVMGLVSGGVSLATMAIDLRVRAATASATSRRR